MADSTADEAMAVAQEAMKVASAARAAQISETTVNREFREEFRLKNAEAAGRAQKAVDTVLSVQEVASRIDAKQDVANGSMHVMTMQIGAMVQSSHIRTWWMGALTISVIVIGVLMWQWYGKTI